MVSSKVSSRSREKVLGGLRIGRILSNGIGGNLGYYEEDGEGEALVLLHPGLADSRAFEEYLLEFAHHFHVFRPDRRGHGCTPDVEGPITYEQMARDTIAFLEQVVGPAYLLGHSDGATLALLAALERPYLVRKLLFSSGAFHHDGWAPGAIDLDDETLAFFI